MSLLNRNAYQYTINDADRRSGTPEPTIWTKWFGGLIVPAVTLAYGINCCIVKKALFIGTAGFGRHGMKLDGSEAVAMGITWICLALFIHFHYFWPTLKRLYIFTELGKIVSALGLIASLGYVFWSIVKSWV
jgi:hypothetical protein